MTMQNSRNFLFSDKVQKRISIIKTVSLFESIAGADKNFVWAEAKIDGDKIIVSSPSVKEPAAVRYAWADNPVFSVSSKDNLPLAPFRTDDWAAGTAGKVSNPRASP